VCIRRTRCRSTTRCHRSRGSAATSSALRLRRAGALVASLPARGAAVGPGAGHWLPRPVRLFRLEFRAQFGSRAIPLPPAAALGIAASTRKSWRIVATLLTVLLMAYRSPQIARRHPSGSPSSIRACPWRLSRALSADPFGRYPGECDTIVIRPQRPVDAILSRSSATRLPRSRITTAASVRW
jgi:hypothetical protein